MSAPPFTASDRADLLFSAEPTQRAIARELYALARPLPLISPHGHVDPAHPGRRRARSRTRPGCSSCPTTT